MTRLAAALALIASLCIAEPRLTMKQYLVILTCERHHASSYCDRERSRILPERH